MAGISASGPGAVRAAAGTIELNADRTAAERVELVVLNTGDRPVQIGSHLHLPDANAALAFDRAAAHGFRLDVPAGTSQRFEPGASRTVAAVALRGARRVPGIQRGKVDGGPLDAKDDGGAAHGGSATTEGTGRTDG
ncbi:urease subunit beta [Georgenia muralis]|uniref:Urease subunit beta n=1 Tax=Georgenia muralis TaxID=154117 RepID=A0A3N4ZL89_9MICO|nr:urease subunit beta [Georgenia muralis]RPF26452.1 urease subunit beta [Georgenia muralis]